jgi:hypothetical protein
MPCEVFCARDSGNPLACLRVLSAKAEKGTQNQRKDVEWVAVDAQATLGGVGLKRSGVICNTRPSGLERFPVPGVF